MPDKYSCMRFLTVVLILFSPLSFYGQTDTIADVKEPVMEAESMVKTDVDYRRKLDSIYSFFRKYDTVENDLKTSVVSAEKLNVVYRGMPNPISISVPDAKLFEATAPGLTKLSEGRYNLNPGSGLESTIIIYIIHNDGSKKKETHTFRIKNLPYLSGVINGLTCNQSVILMSKQELRDAILSIGFSKEILYELEFNLVSFAVKIDKKYIYISGNKLNKKALDLIEKLPLKSIFEITDFKSDTNCTNCSRGKIMPLRIMLAE
jgi:hypothetical protein